MRICVTRTCTIWVQVQALTCSVMCSWSAVHKTVMFPIIRRESNCAKPLSVIVRLSVSYHQKGTSCFVHLAIWGPGFGWLITVTIRYPPVRLSNIVKSHAKLKLAKSGVQFFRRTQFCLSHFNPIQIFPPVEIVRVVEFYGCVLILCRCNLLCSDVRRIISFHP